MRLPALEFLERTEPGIRVVEADHEAERHLVVVGVVQERSAISVLIERPAGGVDHQPGLVFFGGDLPELLEPDAVALRVAAGVELESLDQLPAQVAPSAFGEHGVAAMQFHAELKAALRLAVFAEPKVAGGHALDRAVIVVEHFSRREAGKDLDPQGLGLLRHPANHVAQADDVVAVIPEAVRQQKFRRGARTGFIQEQELVLRDLLLKRRAERVPVGQQFVERARIHDRAAEDVGAGLRALFENHHGHLGTSRRGALFEPDRRGQAAGPAAHDHDVVVHGFARTILFKQRGRRHFGSSEGEMRCSI